MFDVHEVPIDAKFDLIRATSIASNKFCHKFSLAVFRGVSARRTPFFE